MPFHGVDPSVFSYNQRQVLIDMRKQRMKQIEEANTIGKENNQLDSNDYDDEVQHDEAMHNMFESYFETNENDDMHASSNENGDHEQFEMDEDEILLRKEADTPLYPGASISRLATSILILNLQATYKWSDRSVTSLFGYLTHNTTIILYSIFTLS